MDTNEDWAAKITSKADEILAAADSLERSRLDSEVSTFRQMVEARAKSRTNPIGAQSPYANRSRVEPGSFISAVMQARSRDYEEQSVGKATLEEMTRYQTAAEVGAKSTLGGTDATGGWIAPNAVVDELNKPSLLTAPYQDLMTVRDGINAFAVDVPFRSATPARAVVALAGATKENLDLAYNGYTATMYTLARIYDIGNQFLRQSAGAAEADVLEELATAFRLGEAYYIINGTGSNEPRGIITALTNGPAAFTSSFTPSATTLAGSVAAGIAKATGALMARGRTSGLSAVMTGTAYASLLSQGTDTAGFFINTFNSDGYTLPGAPIGALISPFGVACYADNTLPSDDRLIVGQWKAATFYRGQSYRVDTSDEAGTRWDSNLTGFRGEEEVGFDARPAVYAGAFQTITDILP